MRAKTYTAAPLLSLAVLAVVVLPAAIAVAQVQPVQQDPEAAPGGSAAAQAGVSGPAAALPSVAGDDPAASVSASADPSLGTSGSGLGAQAPMLPRLTWDPAWGRSGTPNYVLIGTSLAVIGLSVGVGPRVENPAQGGILWDEPARDTLRIGNEHGRQVARDISDVLLTILVSYPTAVDALLVAAWMHESPDVAIEMGLMHAEVVSLLLAVHQATTVAVSRERPYGRTCGGGGPDDTPEDTRQCDSSERYVSFFSGHASQSFAGAALTCINHMYLDLYGGSAVGPCITGFVMAGAVGLLRVMGDMHYSTDVITGAFMGTAVGFLLPYLLHYGHDDAPLTINAGGEDGVTMSLLPTPTGASIFGAF